MSILSRKKDTESQPEQGHGQQQGFTRKGMGRAKPAREAASTVKVVQARGPKGKGKGGSRRASGPETKEEKRARKNAERAERDRLLVASGILLKQEPLYKKRRNLWWVLLGLGMACTACAWILFVQSPTMEANAGTIMLLLAYVFIIGGFIYDWVRIRPLRRDCDEAVAHMPNRRVQQLIDDDAAAREAKKAARAAKRAQK